MNSVNLERGVPLLAGGRAGVRPQALSREMSTGRWLQVDIFTSIRAGGRSRAAGSAGLPSLQQGSRAPPVQERLGIRTGPDVLYRALGPIYTDPHCTALLYYS
jgi:hypothetical protein